MSVPVEFWFEFASSYSYLSVMRIEDEAAKRDISIIWRPFLLGPAFKAHGWDTSPFRVYPLKAKYMWRDVARYGETFSYARHRVQPSTA